MKVAIITDQHFGARKSSRIFHEFFLKFYNKVFFPTLKKEKITTVFDLGDTFDNRRQIDLWAAKWARENYYDRLRDMNVEVHAVVGNHTAYFKDTMKILRPLINLLKVQIATTRWGTLSSTDLKLIVDTSWSTVLRANAIRSSLKFYQVITITDLPEETSST